MQQRTPWQTTVAWATAIEGNVAVVKTTALEIFENSASGWQRTAQLPVTDPDAFGRTGIQMNAGTILLDGPECSWEAFRKRSGAWARVGLGYATPSSCGFGISDISGTTIAVGNPSAGSINATYASDIRIFDGYTSPFPSLQFTSPFGENDASFGGELSLVEPRSLWTTSQLRKGAHRLSFTDGIGWQFVASAVPLDAFNDLGAPNLDSTLDLLVAARPQDALRAVAAGGIGVFQRNSAGAYDEVARLVASDAELGANLGRQVKVHGRRIAAATNKAVYVYDLPSDLSQPARFQDTFETSGAARWAPIAGSSFAVATSSSRVYRQSSLAGDAAAFVTDLTWKDQAIEADVRAREFNGADRWVGLAVRRTNASNYYYVTARASGVIQLRRMLNGTFSTLMSAPFPVALDRNYRLRLEAIGSWLRVYVDGNLILQGRDTTLTKGQAGVVMYKARADYDNVIVSPHPRFSLYDDRNYYWQEGIWSNIDGAWQYASDATIPLYYSQTSSSGNARAVTGVATGAQQVQANIRVASFGATNAWVGLLARFVDARNYYYVTLRRSGVLALRKLVNGTITELDASTLPIAPGTWYSVRLEAVGSVVRVYVGGELYLEATDASHGKGRFGLVTYQAAADFDEVRAGAP